MLEENNIKIVEKEQFDVLIQENRDVVIVTSPIGLETYVLKP